MIQLKSGKPIQQVFAKMMSLVFAACRSAYNNECTKRPFLPAVSLVVMLLSFGCAAAQNQGQMVRLAKLVIDPTQLEDYKSALKEEIEASVLLEPGVRTLYAVSEKDNPTHITILEIYADTAAYKAHLQTPHFLKYKNSTKDMVKSLELVETVPLIPEMKIK